MFFLLNASSRSRIRVLSLVFVFSVCCSRCFSSVFSVSRWMIFFFSSVFSSSRISTLEVMIW